MWVCGCVSELRRGVGCGCVSECHEVRRGVESVGVWVCE